jgi:hypothetical protein
MTFYKQALISSLVQAKSRRIKHCNEQATVRGNQIEFIRVFFYNLVI